MPPDSPCASAPLASTLETQFVVCLLYLNVIPGRGKRLHWRGKRQDAEITRTCGRFSLLAANFDLWGREQETSRCLTFLSVDRSISDKKRRVKCAACHRLSYTLPFTYGSAVAWCGFLFGGVYLFKNYGRSLQCQVSWCRDFKQDCSITHAVSMECVCGRVCSSVDTSWRDKDVLRTCRSATRDRTLDTELPRGSPVWWHHETSSCVIFLSGWKTGSSF